MAEFTGYEFYPPTKGIHLLCFDDIFEALADLVFGGLTVLDAIHFL